MIFEEKIFYSCTEMAEISGLSKSYWQELAQSGKIDWVFQLSGPGGVYRFLGQGANHFFRTQRPYVRQKQIQQGINAQLKKDKNLKLNKRQMILENPYRERMRKMIEAKKE